MPLRRSSIVWSWMQRLVSSMIYISHPSIIFHSDSGRERLRIIFDPIRVSAGSRPRVPRPRASSLCLRSISIFWLHHQLQFSLPAKIVSLVLHISSPLPDRLVGFSCDGVTRARIADTNIAPLDRAPSLYSADGAIGNGVLVVDAAADAVHFNHLDAHGGRMGRLERVNCPSECIARRQRSS